MAQRRVSFAEKSQVRLFDKDHRNSEGSIPSSPEQDPEREVNQPPPVTNDENAYPGANKLRPRRKSSLRRSFGTDIGAGEESMEIDTTKIIALTDELRLTDEGWGGSDEEVGDDEDDMDMDMTEIVRRQSVALRRRSSMHRRSLAPPEEVEQDKSVPEVGESEDDRSHMDFTVPLGQPLRKPEPPPDEWHALRAVTHAGANDSISEDGDAEPNELEDAISRLMVARDSLGLGDGPTGDNSFASTESDSFTQDPADFADADRTINIASMLRRASSGTFTDPSQESTSDYSNSQTNGTNEQIKLPVVLPPENHSPQAHLEPPKLSSSISTKPPPIFQKPTPIQSTRPVFKPPTTETPKATALGASNVFKPRPPERQSVFSLQKPPTKAGALTTPSAATVDVQPQKRPITDTEKPLEERPTPGKRPVISHLTASSTSRASSAPPEGSPSNSTTLAPSSPRKKPGLASNPRKPSSPARGRASSVSSLRRTSASFTHGQKSGAAGQTMLAFGTRVPAPAKARKSAPGDLPSPSKKASSLPPEGEEPAYWPPTSAVVQEPQDEEDMELEQDERAPEPTTSPPSGSPSPLPRPQSPVVSPGEDVEGSGEERSEIETTPPEGDDATGRWRDEVTTASNPESAEEVSFRLDKVLRPLLKRCRFTFLSSNSSP